VDTTEHQPLAVDEALNFAKERPPVVGFWKVLITSFIAIYFSSVIVWLFAELPFQTNLAPYAHWINIADGGVQHWSLFSPNVRHIIYHETAVVTFTDGSLKLYEFPRVEKMNQWDKFRHEKLRKLFGDCIPWPDYRVFLPSVSQFLAFCNTNKDNQPAIITMIFNSSENPQPDPNNWEYRDKLPFHTEKAISFVYNVRECDLINGASGRVQEEHSNQRVFEQK
jgi:hypothetical protein